MKYFYSLIFVFSASLSAQEYEPKHELQANKAEYYIGTFNKGKGIDDLVSWYEKFAKWASTTDGTYNNMTVGLLQPYFHSALNDVDVMWVNTWPTPSEQFNGLETWITGGGAKLLESIPVTNSQQIDTWQWVVSEPSSTAAGNMMYATYADCSLEEGYTPRQVYDLYKDFAIYAASQGDTVGRKMIFPDAGVALADDVDFVRLMFTSSISERGTNAELFYSKISDSEASANLQGFSCTNARSFFGMSMQ
jgi:hypothetical protein